jgi:hypothetical protein
MIEVVQFIDIKHISSNHHWTQINQSNSSQNASSMKLICMLSCFKHSRLVNWTKLYFVLHFSQNQSMGIGLFFFCAFGVQTFALNKSCFLSCFWFFHYIDAWNELFNHHFDMCVYRFHFFSPTFSKCSYEFFVISLDICGNNVKVHI